MLFGFVHSPQIVFHVFYGTFGLWIRRGDVGLIFEEEDVKDKLFEWNDEVGASWFPIVLI